MDQNRDDIFVDDEGNRIMMPWRVLSFTLATCLHRRAITAPGNSLSMLETDILRHIAKLAYTGLIRMNFTKLFQVFGARIEMHFETLTYNHERMQLDVSPEQIRLHNPVTRAYFCVAPDIGSSSLIIRMGRSSFFKFFISDADGSRFGHVYHTLAGGDFNGFEFVVETQTRRYFSKAISFPDDMATLRMLMEAAVPDIARGKCPRSYSFAVVARKLQRNYAKMGMDVELVRRSGPNRTEIGIRIKQSDVFTVSIHQYEEDAMNICLYPMDVFEQNMESDTDIEGDFTLNHISGSEAKRFYGFTRRRFHHVSEGGGRYIRSRYEIAHVTTDSISMDVLQELVSSAVEIGMSRTHPLGPYCQRCGVRMGEGGMDTTMGELLCVARQQLGLETV
jgi:hypothetical protein